ncbi:MAG: hypothetical protein MRZ61_10310, partial [Oscillospiraceae bacterium]|nr:hypothetical protein [Oscillospiraceae bacterium]
YIAAGNSLIIHYSFFTIHYSFSEALCKGTTFRGTGGGALVQKGRWAALPLSPLRFSLCTLFPQTSNPLQATAMRFPVNLLFAVTIVSFNDFLERAHTVRPYRKNVKKC